MAKKQVHPEPIHTVQPQSDPNSLGLPERKGTGKKVFLVIITALIVGAFCITGTWYYMNKKAENQKNEQAARLQELNQQIKSLQENGKATQESTSNDQPITYKDSDGILQIQYPADYYKKDLDITSGGGYSGTLNALSLTPPVAVIEHNKKYGNSYFALFYMYLIKTNLSPKDYLKLYDLTQGKVEKSTTINGYPAYYVVYENKSYTDEVYAITNGKGNIVIFRFRIKDVHYTIDGKVDYSDDYSKYEPEFQKIVNSTQFFN